MTFVEFVYIQVQKLTKSGHSRYVPEQFKQHDMEFDKVVTYESQMKSLEKRGFLRAYKPYTVPEDVEAKFMSAVQKALPEFQGGELNEVDLSQDLKLKAKILNALNVEFGHMVPNSMLHEIRTLDEAFR